MLCCSKNNCTHLIVHVIDLYNVVVEKRLIPFFLHSLARKQNIKMMYVNFVSFNKFRATTTIRCDYFNSMFLSYQHSLSLNSVFITKNLRKIENSPTCIKSIECICEYERKNCHQLHNNIECRT